MTPALPPRRAINIGSWRIEFGAGALSIAFAIVSAACAAAVIAEIYQPDVSRAMELASQLSFLNLARFRPEPQEKARFLSGLVVFFALLIPLHRWFRRVLSAQPPKAQATVLPRIIIASVLGIGVLGCIDMGEGNPFISPLRIPMIMLRGQTSISTSTILFCVNTCSPTRWCFSP